MLPVAAPDVIVKSLPDGAVLYHPAQEVYYGLNRVGEQIWGLLPICDSVDGVCAELHRSYPEVSLETLHRDVTELLDDLRANGLVLANAAHRTNAETGNGSAA